LVGRTRARGEVRIPRKYTVRVFFGAHFLGRVRIGKYTCAPYAMGLWLAHF